MKNGESTYRRYLDGDEGAFDEIWKEYRDPLTFFIDRIVQDRGDAEDIAIDVFAYVLLHPARYDFRTSLKTYLFMLGRSRALDALRHRKVITFVELAEADRLADRRTVEDAVLRSEDLRRLNAALATLPEEMQLAVHLVYLEGFSYDEVGKILKKNRKQIDNLLYRAKNALRTFLGKEDPL